MNDFNPAVRVLGAQCTSPSKLGKGGEATEAENSHALELFVPITRFGPPRCSGAQVGVAGTRKLGPRFPQRAKSKMTLRFLCPGGRPGYFRREHRSGLVARCALGKGKD
jgi:hypothetical protein